MLSVDAHCGTKMEFQRLLGPTTYLVVLGTFVMDFVTRSVSSLPFSTRSFEYDISGDEHLNLLGVSVQRYWIIA